MSDIRRTQFETQLFNQLVEELVKTPRALAVHEAALLARKALEWRHIAAHFDAERRGEKPPPYLARELEVRPDAPCPVCGQNVRVAVIPEHQSEENPAMPTMRAKVSVTDITKPYDGAEEVKFVPVVSGESFGPNGESENNTYARYTPSGDIKLTITNPELHGKFTRGQEFYVDFTEAPKPATVDG